MKADITDLEEFRKQQSSELAEEGVKAHPAGISDQGKCGGVAKISTIQCLNSARPLNI